MSIFHRTFSASLLISPCQVSSRESVWPWRFGKIYTFGPTFRAERSFTARHAAEFWMIEPEIAFADLYDDMALSEAMIKYVIKYVLVTAATI